MLEHLPACEQAQKIAQEGRKQVDGKAVKIDHIAQQQQRRQTLAMKFQEHVVDVKVEFPAELFIFQKDSRTISIYNVPTNTVSHKTVEFEKNFPHNFQMCQIGLVNPRVFLIGGGDYKSLPDSMFQCRELCKKLNGGSSDLYFQEKKKMKYARHGHSICVLLERFVLVTGSRKEVAEAAQKAELYDSQHDAWLELAKINEGRHYHSSCNF